MKTAIALVTIVAFCAGDIVVQVQASVCPVCHHDPCTCGGGSGHHRDRARVGVGVNVDLSGVGRRKSEPDPFAVSTTSSSTSRTEEKKSSKKPAKESTDSGNAFANIKLTGEKAKEVKVADATQAANNP